ncbi:MAG: hypothetical protein GDA45_06985 [Chromatiales bacterium]|nr:hypothetical protein [Chromatiales bacterium]
MFEIALYTALTKLGLSPEEAKEAVADVASSKDVATKADLANLEIRLTKLIFTVALINSGIIIAAVGLMIKFLN